MRRSATVIVRASLAVALVAPAAYAGPLDGCGLPPGSEACETWSSRVASSAARFNSVQDRDGVVYATGHDGYDILTAAFDATTGERLWTARQDVGGTDEGVKILISNDGETVFSVGHGGSDYVILAYAASNGLQRWAQISDGFGFGDYVRGAALSTDGSRIFVTGYGGRADNRQSARTIAVSMTDGHVIWSKDYTGPANFWSIPMGLAVAQVPGVGELVAMTSRTNVASSSNDHTDVVTVAYNTTSGEQAWVNIFDGALHSREYPYAIEASPDGSSFYVAAESTVAGTGLDYATFAIGATDGAASWARTFHGGFGDDRPIDLAVSPDGARVFVTGFTPNASGLLGAIDRSATTVAYSSDGDLLWSSKSSTPGGEAGAAIDVSPDGESVYVAGLTVGQAIGVGIPLGTQYVHLNGFLTLSYDAGSGGQRWVARFRDPGSGQAVHASQDGGVFVAGGGTDALLLRYEP